MESYYYLDGNQQQQGPIPPSDFMRKGITRHTLLWKNGMAGWQAAGTIPELAPYFQATTPPPPPPVTDRAIPEANTFKPDTYLLWSVLTTVLCCLPLGIVAIVFSLKADGLWARGEYQDARGAAEKAKNCCIASAILAVISYISMLFLWSSVW